MSPYGVERLIGLLLLVGTLGWFAFVAWTGYRDERRARWRRDDVEAEEFVRSLREHPAGQAVVVSPTPIERQRAKEREALARQHISILLRRVRWLRRRVEARPDGPSFDRRELAALEWALAIAQERYPRPVPKLAFADDVVAVAMLDGPL